MVLTLYMVLTRYMVLTVIRRHLTLGFTAAQMPIMLQMRRKPPAAIKMYVATWYVQSWSRESMYSLIQKSTSNHRENPKMAAPISCNRSDKASFIICNYV